VQTLKTAIVVLLMMTVMYGCYVSLTTAPDTLPEHIAQLIEESDSFGDLAIDAGLPDSMTTLGISDSAAYDAGELDLEDGPAELTFSDGPSTRLSDVGNPSAAGAAQPPAAGSLASLHLPKPSESSPAIVADYERDYPSTQTAELNLPDPRSLGTGSPSPPGFRRAAASASRVGFSSGLVERKAAAISSVCAELRWSAGTASTGRTRAARSAPCRGFGTSVTEMRKRPIPCPIVPSR
jgi:hypothetical protein